MKRMVWIVVGVLVLSASAFAVWDITSPEDETPHDASQTIVASGNANENCSGEVRITKNGQPAILAQESFSVTEETAWGVDIIPPGAGWGENGDLLAVKLFEVDGEDRVYYDQRTLILQAAE